MHNYKNATICWHKLSSTSRSINFVVCWLSKMNNLIKIILLDEQAQSKIAIVIVLLDLVHITMCIMSSTSYTATWSTRTSLTMSWLNVVPCIYIPYLLL